MIFSNLDKNDLSPPPIFFKFKETTINNNIYRKDTALSIYEEEMNKMTNNYHQL